MRPVQMIGALLLAGFVGVTAVAQEVPFTGVVENNNELRAGAGRTFYVVGQVKKGDTVTVDEVIFGWLKIVPPSGTYSLISKAFVNRQGDGKEGTVNQDHADVKAANVEPSGTSYRRQVDLMTGDKVKIVGEESDYYKIVAPKGAYVYLPPGAVRRASADEAAGVPAPAPSARSAEPAAAPREPAAPVGTTVVVEAAATGPAATEPAATEPASTEPAATEPVVEIKPPPPPPEEVSAPVKEAEQRIEEALKLPLEQQPLDSLIQQFDTLAARDDLNRLDRLTITGRLRQLHRNAELVKALQEVAQVKQRVDEQRVEILKPTAAQAAPPVYDAVGQLVASSVYDGQNLPRFLRLVEPATMRTIGYVRLSHKDQMAALGRVVGIVGRPHYDASLKLRIIDAQRVDVLTPNEAPTTQPPATQPSTPQELLTK